MPDRLDPDTARQRIAANRGAFGSYNVTRLRELIRRLPERGRELFETMPLLLHVNAPQFPGYVDHPEVPHGIYRFSESGFWRVGRRRLGLKADTTIQAFLLKRYPLRGIYLAGSAGTLGQTELSDLNYWILIEATMVSEVQRSLLWDKLERLKAWALETYDQALTFMVVDRDQLRRADFVGIEDPCSASPPGSLMKEEFYRTFVLVAGQIPLWAVIPARLTDEAYSAWAQAVDASADKDFSADDYVDLGNLTSIEKPECRNALISEICRAREDPVRSLIKGSVIASYYFAQDQHGLLCDRVKEGFSGSGAGGQPIDPALAAFQQAVRFYESIDDREGLEIARLCVYLKLIGYPLACPPGEHDPRQALLNRLLNEWSWPREQASRIESFIHWKETEKLDLEERILRKLWFLLDLIGQAGGRQDTGRPECTHDWEALRERTEDRFASKPGKIPHGSAYLRSGKGPSTLHVALLKDTSGTERWVVSDHPPHGPRVEVDALFSDPDLVRVLSWIVLNRPPGPVRESLVFHHPQSPILVRRLERFLHEVGAFFQMEKPPRYLLSEPGWRRLVVVLDLGVDPSREGLAGMHLLVQNTWADMFLVPLDLGHIENNLLRCYEIAKRIRQFDEDACPTPLAFKVFHARTAEQEEAAKQIEEFMRSFRTDGPGASTG